MTPTLAGYLVFGGYIVLNIVIGLWSGRQQKGADDLWTAGRRFGTVVMVLGLMSSIMHGGSILSGVAFAAAYGGVAILPLISFAAGFLVILLFFARKLRDIGAFTLSDFMADRYASVGLRAFTAVVIAVSCTVYLVAQIRGMGIVLAGLLNLPFVPAMAVGTLLFVFYVVVGGILAVMWNNIAQFLIMWLGLAGHHSCGLADRRRLDGRFSNAPRRSHRDGRQWPARSGHGRICCHGGWSGSSRIRRASSSLPRSSSRATAMSRATRCRPRAFWSWCFCCSATCISARRHESSCSTD